MLSSFFQFEDVSLNTCLWLLERAQLATAARANPLRVTRCVSAMVINIIDSSLFKRKQVPRLYIVFVLLSVIVVVGLMVPFLPYHI